MAARRVDWEHETPTFEDRQVREVYARFGLAAYCCQCVEKTLGVMLASMYGEHWEVKTREDYDRVLGEQFDKTFGRMARDLGDVVDLPDAFEGRLRHAISERNRLMHAYFWDSAGKFVSSDGREAMIAELQEVVDFLRGFDDELTGVHQCWLDSVGISEERVRREAAKLEQDAKWPGGSGDD